MADQDKTATCPRCSAKVERGMLHSCGSNDIFAPILISIEEKLERIGSLLAAAAPAHPADKIATTGKTSSRAARRETR